MKKYVVYHGTHFDFEEFNEDFLGFNDHQINLDFLFFGLGFFFSSKKIAETYSKEFILIKAEIKLSNPYIIDAKGGYINSVIEDLYKSDMTEEYLKNNYDGIIIKNLIDYVPPNFSFKNENNEYKPETHFCVFNKKNIKILNKEYGSRYNGVTNDPIYSKILEINNYNLETYSKNKDKYFKQKEILKLINSDNIENIKTYLNKHMNDIIKPICINKIHWINKEDKVVCMFFEHEIFQKVVIEDKFILIDIDNNEQIICNNEDELNITAKNKLEEMLNFGFLYFKNI